MTVTTYEAAYELRYTHDALGGEIPGGNTSGEFATLAHAIGGLRRLGHGYIVHLATGLERHELPRQPGCGSPDIIWIDSDGEQHAPPD